VSYNAKHNEANGEHNRDGADDNRSWNCGVEGPSEDAAIERLRTRQAKNMLTTTLLSLGLPMILMGDEVRRTQVGNNNAYCQDNETSWFDWSRLETHADLHRFVKLLAARRLQRDAGPERRHTTLTELIGRGIKGWHGVALGRPDWGDRSHSLALSVELPDSALRAHLIFNAYWEPLQFELPRLGEQEDGVWRRWIDTALEPPDDIVPWDEAARVPRDSYQAGPRSVVVLWAQAAPPEPVPAPVRVD
jgi:glycogen operon protein